MTVPSKIPEHTTTLHVLRALWKALSVCVSFLRIMWPRYFQFDHLVISQSFPDTISFTGLSDRASIKCGACISGFHFERSFWRWFRLLLPSNSFRLLHPLPIWARNYRSPWNLSAVLRRQGSLFDTVSAISQRRDTLVPSLAQEPTYVGRPTAICLMVLLSIRSSDRALGWNRPKQSFQSRALHLHLPVCRSIIPDDPIQYCAF